MICQNGKVFQPETLPEQVVTDAAVLVPLDERIAELTASHQRDSERLQALEEAVRTAGREHKTALAAHRSARSRLESATDAAHTTRTALEACERSRDQAQRDRDGALQELDDALAGREGWRDAALAPRPPPMVGDIPPCPRVVSRATLPGPVAASRLL